MLQYLSVYIKVLGLNVPKVDFQYCGNDSLAFSVHIYQVFKEKTMFKGSCMVPRCVSKRTYAQ